MTSADEIRDAQRVTWAGLSAGWEKWDSVIMDQLGPVGAAIIESLDIADGHEHLDIASGTGEPGLSIAKLLPKGRVVLTDLAAEMLDVAARRAMAQGIANIETKVCSADDLPFNDASFDSVSVRFGYMFFPDVAKATGSSCVCSSRVVVSARRCGSSPRRTRGRRLPCRRSRQRRWWRHQMGTHRVCFDARRRAISVPCTRVRSCATLSSGTSTSNS